MRLRSLSWIVLLAGLVAAGIACGGDGNGDGSGTTGGGQVTGRVPPPTPTTPPADVEATKAAAPQYGGGYGGGGLDTGELTAAEATDYIGKQGKVCGTVMATVYEPEHQYKVTFLNIDKAEDPDFFVYFWHSGKRIGDWPDIADPDIDLTTWFDGKTVCAEGLIQKYREKPGINAGFWHQLEVREQ